MFDMTDEPTAADNTIILAGRVVGFIKPTTGQLESMVRIARSLQRGTDDEPSDFWVKQIDRIGTLLESMIAEGDRDTVDHLYLTGKLSHGELLKAILDKMGESTVPTEAKTKAKTASVKRR